MGPPFELHGTYVVPSYGLKYEIEEAKVGVSSPFMMHMCGCLWFLLLCLWLLGVLAQESQVIEGLQCCGSGMFIPDPNFSIPDTGSEFLPSRIQDPHL
jgi:hypothetical protein